MGKIPGANFEDDYLISPARASIEEVSLGTTSIFAGARKAEPLIRVEEGACQEPPPEPQDFRRVLQLRSDCRRCAEGDQGPPTVATGR